MGKYSLRNPYEGRGGAEAMCICEHWSGEHNAREPEECMARRCDCPKFRDADRPWLWEDDDE